MGNLKKKSENGTWVCRHGCNQEEYINSTGGYCPHLEKLIGPAEGRNKRFQLRPVMEIKQDEVYEMFTGDPEVDYTNNLRRKLLDHGIPSRKVEMVLARTENGLTFAEIAKEFGYSEKGAARKAYKDILKLIKTAVYKGDK